MGAAARSSQSRRTSRRLLVGLLGVHADFYALLRFAATGWKVSATVG